MFSNLIHKFIDFCCFPLFYFQILGNFLVVAKWNCMEMNSFTFRCYLFLVNFFFYQILIFFCYYLPEFCFSYESQVESINLKMAFRGKCLTNAFDPYMGSLELQRKSNAKNQSRYFKVFLLELLHCVTDKLSS